jgi:glycosyltransferase involved in cell wall biosynthesis
LNICIVYNLTQKYREAIWRELSNDSWNFEIYSDYVTNLSIKQIDKKDIKFFNANAKLNIFPFLKNIYFKKILIFQKNLFNIIKSKPYDIYIFLGDIYSLSTWLSLIYLKLKNHKTIIWTHGAYGNENIFKRYYYKTFLKLADGILVYENRAKKILINEFKLKSEVCVVYNSLDYKLQNKIKLNLFSKPKLSNSRYFCFIGGIQKRKNIQILLDSFIHLKNKNLLPNYKLFIIGDGIDFNYYSNKYKTDDIVFTGAIYDEETIANYLYNAEAMISPGHVGLNVIHSLSYGTPVITHSNHFNHAPEFEAITNETGAFFEEGSLESLSNTIIKWVDSKRDRNITRLKCYKIIDEYYNPINQKLIIKNLINNIIK